MLLLTPRVLDISYNKMDNESAEEFIGLLKQMDKLAVLYLMGNPIVGY